MEARRAIFVARWLWRPSTRLRGTTRRSQRTSSRRRVWFAMRASFRPSCLPGSSVRAGCVTARIRTSAQAFYVDPGARGPNLCTASVLHGKELSYNNMLDLDSALRLIRLFAEPAACILKHNNPCGAALAADLATAFERAYEGDPVSAVRGNRRAQPARRPGDGPADVPAGPVPGSNSCPGLRARRPSVADDHAKLEEQRPADRPRGTDRSGRSTPLRPGPQAYRWWAPGPELGPARA